MISQPYFVGTPISINTPDWIINQFERQKYEGQYRTLPLDGLGRLSGRTAKRVFEETGLPVHVLSRVWSLVDQDTDGFINMNEFCAAQYLVKKVKEGYALPQSLPLSLLSSTAPTSQPWGGTSYASQSLPRNYHPSQNASSDFFQSLQPTQQSLPIVGRSNPQPTPFMANELPSSTAPAPTSAVQGIGITVSLSTLSQGWAMSANDRRKYILMFNTLDKKRSGFVGGQEARNELLKSHLSYGTLAKIWELADIDKDGLLSTNEFCIAMHLCEKAKQGLTIPPNLPPELAKESVTGKSITSSKSSEPLTLEDKWKDNFEKGRQELERRRQEMKAQQEKERAEKERKLQEEEERKREKQRQEEERRRLIELERQRQIAAEQERERQRLALLREEEERKRERMLREEWARGRCRDVEVKCQVERGLVQRLQSRRNDLEAELSQLLAKKKSLQDSLSQQQELCDRYRSALRHTSVSHDMRSAELAELKFNLQEVTLELGSVRSEYGHLSSAAHQSMFDQTHGMQRQQFMDIKSQLETSLTSLRAQMTFLTDVHDKTKIQQKEGDEKLKEVTAMLEKEEKALDQLKSLLEKQQKVYAEKKAAEMKRQEERRKEIEKKQKQEELRQQQLETERQKGLEKKRKQEEDKAKLEAKKQQEEEQRKHQQIMDRQRWVDMVDKPPLVPQRNVKAVEDQPVEQDTKKTSTEPLSTVLAPEDILVAMETSKLSAQKTGSPVLKPKPLLEGKGSPKPIVKAIKRPAIRKPITKAKSTGAPSEETAVPDISSAPVARERTKTGTGVTGETPAKDDENEVMKKVREMQEKRLAAKRKQEEEKKRNETESVQQQQQQQQQQQPDSMVMYRVLYSYQATREDELTVVEGDVVKSCVLPMLVPNGWLACEINQKKGLVPESYLAVIDQNKSQIEQQVSIPEISIQTENTGKENVYGNLEIKSENIENEDIYSVPRPRSEYVNFENFEDHKGEEGPAHGPSDKTTVLKTVKVTSDWSGSGSNELSLKQDQLVSVLDEKDTWYFGKSGAKSGWFPKTYVEGCEENRSLAAVSPLPEKWQAIYDFIGEEEGDLTFSRGEIIEVLDKAGDWWVGRVGDKQGIFPGTYVRPDYKKQTSMSSQSSLQPPLSPTPLAPPQELQKRPVVARVVQPYSAVGEGQLSLTPGQLVHVKKQVSDGWWEGELQSRGQKKQMGWFPSQFVELLPSRTRETSPMARNRSSSSITSTGSGSNIKAAARVLCHVLALYTYNAENNDELTFHKGSVIGVLSKDSGDWWYGDINGRQGLFPSNYVQSLDDLLPVPGSKWSESVPRDTLAFLTTMEINRQEAIFELVNTEQSYTESLKVVKEVFFDPMEKAHVLSGDELARVKVNWDELIECSEKFSNVLLTRLRSSKMVVDRIGRVLIDQIPTLKGHIRWCSCQLQACTILQNKTSNPFYREFEQKCSTDPRTKDLPLSSFLLKPMQRVTKYPLLIKRIIEYTPASHSDMEDLKFAYDVATSLCSDVNEGVRSTDNTDKLEWLQQHVQIVGIQENLVFNSLTNFMGLRKILHTGKLVKVRGNKPLLGFLFNDFLLLAKPSSFFEQNLEPYGTGHFLLYRTLYVLDQIRVMKEPNAECFRLVSEGEEKEIVLKCDSEEARNAWLQKVVKASIAFSQAKRKRNKELKEKSRASAGIATLEVLVKEAADLKGADVTGKSDPFCVIKFANQEQSTKHIPQNCSPKWNEKFIFQVQDPQSDTLEITVFDRDIFSPNDFLGCAKLPLSKLLSDGPGPWKKRILLEDVPKGEVEMEIELIG